MLPAVEAPAWLLEIVARSRFLWERLGSTEVQRAAEPPVAGNALAEARLTLWRSRLGASAGDADPVRARLTRAGQKLEDAYPVLCQRGAEPGDPLPDWAPVLLRIEQAARGLSAAARSAPPLHAADPIPFELVVLPAVLVGRDLLQERLARLPASEAERARRALSDDARQTLERALLAHLASFCARPLVFELSKLRTFGENLVNELELPLASTTARFDRFVEQTLADGLVPVLLAYPVLARLLATAVCLWVESSGDFIERVSRDLLELERVFAPGGGPLGRVVALDPMLSDRHEGGRSVIALQFEQGIRLVYKPRDLGVHVGFNHVLEYCNRHSGLPPLEPLRVLARDGYGFVEFAEHQPCSTSDEAAAFYQRAGMLLCLLHVLRATDCHHENLIANGPQLVLIDVETILHPRDPGLDDAASVRAVAPTERFLDSVLRTGMLPRWNFSADQRVAYDTSALGSTTPQRVPRKVTRWVGVNTDAVHIRQTEADFPLEKNVARFDGQALDPSHFRGEIRAGFRAMYNFLLARKSELLAGDGPLEALRGQRARYLFRNSQVYGSVLDEAQTPESFQDGVAFSIALEPLARVFVSGVAPAGAATLLDAELRSLERQDIPLFWVDSGSTDLCASDGLRVPGYFAQSSYDDVRDQVRNLSASDCALQAAIVQGAFDALAARTEATSTASAIDGSTPALSDRELLAEAMAIGDEFCARAIPDERGGVTWLGFTYVSEAERFQHQMLGDWLYDGVAGVALFLAALFDATKEPRFADLARGAIVDLRSRARAPAPHDLTTPRSIGGALGLGSLLYAFSEIAVLLADATISNDALALAESIAANEVAADQQLDVMGGAAGMILGLASLHRVTGSARSLELARLCGHRLLEAQKDGAWPTLGSVALLGMSHGAAGISYALLRLHALTGESAFLDAGLRGIQYERGLFSAAGGRWPDLRPPLAGGERGGTPVQWCHGAAGIGLARIGCARLTPSEDLEREIDAALDATMRVGLGRVDHLCCGNMGRIETLLVGAEHRNSAELRAAARSHASELVGRARSGGGYCLFGNLDRGVWNPGLFQGMAGIGYQLLRLRSDEVRSFALWQ